MKAALDLFLAKGYERATFVDVAARIGLSKGAVYWHFKSKADLLVALTEQMAEKHAKALEGMCYADSLEGLRDDLLARAELVVKNAESRKFFKMMMLLDLSSRQNRPLKDRIILSDRGIYMAIFKTLQGLQERGRVNPDVNIKVAATVLLITWLGLVRARVDHGTEVDLHNAIILSFEMAGAALIPTDFTDSSR